MVKLKISLLAETFLASAFFLALSSCSPSGKSPDFVKDMTLVWSDEFDVDGEANGDNWSYSEGAHGWGNAEVQNYTKERTNSWVQGGSLKIAAVKDKKGKWSSARLNSRWKKAFTYGYVEFRAKVPDMEGSWPALWLLSDTAEYGQWPRSGEIDVMEHARTTWGDKTYGTVHCSAGYGGNPVKSEYTVVKNIEKKWHTYGILWSEDSIVWYYDAKPFCEYKNPHLEEDNRKAWPFDKDFYIIMNVAMGGGLGGKIPKDAEYCQMEVDYVRWYK